MYKKRSDIFDSSFIYFLIVTFFVMVRIFASTFRIDTVTGYILNCFIQIGLMFCLPVFAYSFMRKQKVRNTFKQYGFNKISIKSVGISFVIGIFVYLSTIFIATFFSSILAYLGYQGSSSGVISDYPLWLLFVELIITAVLPGICEEVAHRGMLLSTYKKFGMKSIVITGLLFGLMHMNIDQFFYTSIIGMFLAMLVLFCDSIYPAMIIHFTNNAISTFMGYASSNSLPISTYLNNFVSSIVGNNFGIIMLFITLTFFVSIVFILSTVIIRDTKIKQIKSVADEMVKQQLRDELMQGIDDDGHDKNDASQNIEITSNSVGERKIFNIIVKNSGVMYQNYKVGFKDKIFMYAAFFVGIITTICTFIWGII